MAAILLLGANTQACAESPALPDYRAEVLNPDFIAGVRSPRTGAFLAFGGDGSLWRSEAAGEGGFALTDVTSTLRALAFSDDGAVAIVVGDAGTLLRSVDDGRTWSRIAVPAQADLRDVRVLPGGSTWLAVGTGATVLRSTDAGVHWDAVPLAADGLDGIDLNALHVGSHGMLLAGGTLGSLWRSNDGGASWQRLQQDGASTPVLALHELGGALWATSSQGRLWRCAAEGAPCDLLHTGSRGFIVDFTATAGGRLLGVTQAGELLSSDDRGKRWTLRPLGQGRALSRVVDDRARGQLLIVGHGGQVLRSRDGGSTWQRKQLPHQPGLTGLSVAPAGVWAFGRDGALYRSDASTAQWHTVAAPQNELVAAMALVPATGTLVTVGQAGWVARSEDAGRRWQPVPMRFVVDMYPTDFMALRAVGRGDALVAAGPTGTIMRSDDDARRWRTVMHTPYERGELLPAIVADAQRGVLLTVESSGAVYRSTDEGRTWQRVVARPRPLPADTLWRTGLVSSRDGVIVLAGQGRELLRSSDGGRRWQTIPLDAAHNLFATLADPDTGTLWLAGAGGVVLRSDDAGLSWTRGTVRTANAGEPLDQTLLQFLPPAAGAERAWLLVGRGGTVLRSTDGHTWEPQPSGSREDLRVLLREPGTGAAVAVGRSGSVLRSADGGRSWQAVFSHTQAHLRTALFLPDGSLVAAGQRLVRMTPRSGP